MDMLSTIRKVVEELDMEAGTACRNMARCQHLANLARTAFDSLCDSPVGKGGATSWWSVMWRLKAALDDAPKLVESCHRHSCCFSWVTGGRTAARFLAIDMRITAYVMDLGLGVDRPRRRCAEATRTGSPPSWLMETSGGVAGNARMKDGEHQHDRKADGWQVLEEVATVELPPQTYNGRLSDFWTEPSQDFTVQQQQQQQQPFIPPRVHAVQPLSSSVPLPVHDAVQQQPYVPPWVRPVRPPWVHGVMQRQAFGPVPVQPVQTAWVPATQPCRSWYVPSSTIATATAYASSAKSTSYASSAKTHASSANTTPYASSAKTHASSANTTPYASSAKTHASSANTTPYASSAKITSRTSSTTTSYASSAKSTSYASSAGTRRTASTSSMSSMYHPRSTDTVSTTSRSSTISTLSRGSRLR